MVASAFARMKAGEYAEVDEGVWAWASAEMLVLALGRPSSPLPPEPFAAAATAMPNADGLVAAALAALDVVVSDRDSEIAQLWNEGGGASLRDHLLPLRSRLRP